jgi:hypothetical protein
VKPAERSGTISKAVACASGESALKSVLIEFVEEAGECDCASVAIPSEFPAFSEKQGRQDSNLQPPVLETSSEASADAGSGRVRGRAWGSRTAKARTARIAPSEVRVARPVAIIRASGPN